MLNDLRITHGGDTAQIDHLVVSPYGLCIIESKSVHGKIIINKHNEWSRTFNDKAEGMSSPVQQGQEQGKIIKELLIFNCEKLLGKLLFGKFQKGFKYCPIWVYVAISDSGIIEREIDVPELFKSDQIVKAIEKKLAECKKQNSLLSLSLDVGWEMEVDETKAVAEFLFSQHKAKSQPSSSGLEKSNFTSQVTTAKSPEKSLVPKSGAICPECGKHKLLRKSVARSDGTETDFLACAGYPRGCKAIFALIAVPKTQTQKVPANADEFLISTYFKFRLGDKCPGCEKGTLVKRKAKTEFLGCSLYPKCKFTDYR